MPTKKPNRTEEIITKIFRDSEMAFGLREFEGIAIHDVLHITEEEKDRYYIKDLKSGKLRFVFDEKKNTGKPEEIVRQLWLSKLNKHYHYPFDRMDTEKDIHFGREIHSKAVDIVVYKPDKITPYILVEVKAPTESKGIEQMKGYLNAEGAEIGVWGNGIKRVILYRFYPREFNDTLPDLP
ncbi:MAG: type I restriction enzyme HsdR N-terminal domain-containing protein [Candidatus Sungbacteria bacterium]|nr:type I restriction enzyme HsdR N-terminal domain-containing protein [Candidatus Sungbacteria bacterium]